ncbi:polysaccharide ABC transporter ATP-binding protein [Pirellulaceae bacterium SH467]
MSLPAISVRNLGKMYRLAHQGKRTDSFREAITSTVLAPFRRISQLRGTDETQEEFWALKDVSFDVQPGEVVGIIGRNGAGKSTLLKILSRIVEPTEGEIRLRGRVASLLEVGTGFHPELTGRENIYLNGSILGMKRREIDKKFDEIVDFAEVEKFLDTPVKRYSSGMYVRLAFAVAAHLDPEILIVDEVLAVGDAEFQKKCLGKMKEVATGRGRTVLFVSHNMAAVKSLCSCALRISAGAVGDYGNVDSVIATHLRSHSDELDSSSVGSFGPFSFFSVQSSKESKDTFKELETSVFSIRAVSKQDIPILGIEIKIQTVGGESLAHLDSHPAHTRISMNASEEKSLVIELSDLPLRPGDYLLSLFLRDDSKFVGWHCPRMFKFEVLQNEDRRLSSRHKNPDGPVAIRFDITESEIIPVA